MASGCRSWTSKSLACLSLQWFSAAAFIPVTLVIAACTILPLLVFRDTAAAGVRDSAHGTSYPTGMTKEKLPHTRVKRIEKAYSVRSTHMLSSFLVSPGSLPI